MMLKMIFKSNFKDMLGPSERQSATAQPRVISITWRDCCAEMPLDAGNASVFENILSVTTT
jgi:hypothetical protein